jgi:hypothetical protein
MLPPKLATQMLRENVASERTSRFRPFKTQKLRPRVVTQQNFFSLPLCDRPGCDESPVISLRNPARFCCRACRQAVRNVQDRERKWLSRGTLDGRKKRHFEYLAARQRRALVHGDGAHPAPLQTPRE